MTCRLFLPTRITYGKGAVPKTVFSLRCVQAVGTGRNVCLVRVTQRDGIETGQYMFVTYCCNCKKGLPTNHYSGSRTQCDTCSNNRNRNFALGGPLDGRLHEDCDEEALPHPYADRKRPLVLQASSERVKGQCCAVLCTKSVLRTGEIRNAGRSGVSGEAKMLCPVHAKVCMPLRPPYCYLAPAERWLVALRSRDVNALVVALQV